MPRPPDLMNLVAWLFAVWLAAATVLVVLLFVPSHRVSFHWTTNVYLFATVLFSAAAFAAMGLDKYRAARGKRRVPEFLLHLFELLGGWPGSMLGQRSFRHKTRKITYQVVFWAIVGMQLVLLAWTSYLWWNPPTPPAVDAPAVSAGEPPAD